MDTGDEAGDEPRGADLTTLHLRAAIRGERAGLEWFVERFTPLLLAQASHRLGPELRRLTDPEDLVQDVWVRVLPRLAGLKPRAGRMTPVVLRFASSTLLNRLNNLLAAHLRRAAEAGRAPEDELIPGLAAETTDAVGRSIRSEGVDAVRQAIAALSDDDRAVVVLRGIEQNPVRDVALLLGLRPNTVTVRYRRALARLREMVPGSVFDELEDEPEAGG